MTTDKPKSRLVSGLLTSLIGLTALACSEPNGTGNDDKNSTSSKVYLLSFLNLDRPSSLDPLEQNQFIDLNGELILTAPYVGENLALELSAENRPTPQASGAIFLHGPDASFLYNQLTVQPRESSTTTENGQPILIREKRSHIVSCQERGPLGASDEGSASYRCGLAIEYKSGRLVDLPHSYANFSQIDKPYQSSRLSLIPEISLPYSSQAGIFEVYLGGLEARLLYDNLKLQASLSTEALRGGEGNSSGQFKLAMQKQGPDITCSRLQTAAGEPASATYQCHLRRLFSSRSTHGVSATDRQQFTQ